MNERSVAVSTVMSLGNVALLSRDVISLSQGLATDDECN